MSTELLAAVLGAVLAVLCWPGRDVGHGPGGATPGGRWWTGTPVTSGASRGTAPERPGAGHEVAPTVLEVADALVLLALVLRGGSGQIEAIETVVRFSPPPVAAHLGRVAAALRWGLTSDEAWAGLPAAWGAAGRAWSMATAAGSAPAAALEDAATRIRAAEQRRVQAAVARAATMLVLPLGLCFLPAFASSTVVPVVLALLGDGLT